MTDLVETKPIWQSTTVIGAAIAVVSAIVGFFGYSVGAEDQAGLVSLISQITGAVGGLIALYGRVKATKKIG